ncbi:MAG TPA: hypothetical protein VF868_14390 [Bacteroidia bacterium]
MHLSKSHLLFILLFHFNLLYSQEERSVLDSLYRPVPVHLLKIDIFKSVSSRLHFDYEYYNGKKSGTELGVNIFYPNRILSYINEGLIFDNSLLVFHYRGVGLELKEKIYFPRKHWNPYFALSLSYDHKYFNNENIYIVSGFRSSSYSFYENWSAKQRVAKAILLAGFASRLKKGFGIEMNFGLGIGYFDSYSIMNSTKSKSTYIPPEMKGKHENYYSPQIGLGVKLYWGFQKRG